MLGLLLLTTCVAMGLGLWNASQRAESFRREMSRALEENRRLRDEYGEFEIADPSLLYAVAMHPGMDTGDYRDWAWRIATPAGTRVTLKYADGMIQVPKNYDGPPAAQDLPKPAYQEVLEPGTHTIRLNFDYDPNFRAAKAWRYRVAVRSELEGSQSSRATVRSMVEPAWPSLVDGEGPLAALFQPSEGLRLGTSYPVATDAFAADKNFVLQRMRVQTVDRKLLPPQGIQDFSEIPGFDRDAPAPGFLIWLEPMP